MNEYSDNEFLIRYNKIKEEHNNIKYAIVNNEYIPKEHHDYPRYFIIPDDRFSNYVINENGVVKQTGIFSTKKSKYKKNSLIKNTINSCTYLMNSLWVNQETKYRARNHTMVCLAFWGILPFDKAEVNHHDGNKQNNHYSNLYWTTHQLNTQHAYDIGLNKQVELLGKPVLVWDTINDFNGENILEFKSVEKASKELKLTNASRVLRQGIQKLINNRYILKYKDDINDWLTINEVYENSYSRPVYGFNIKTKEIINNVTIRQLSKQINVPNNTIKNILVKDLPYTNCGYLFSYNRNENWELMYERYMDKHGDFIVIDLNNINNKFIANCPAEVLSYVNMCEETIRKCLRDNRYLYQYKDNNYLMYYLTDNSDKLKEIKAKYNIK